MDHQVPDVQDLPVFELIERDDDCRAYDAERESGYALAATMFASSLFEKKSKEFQNALKQVHGISLGDLKEVVNSG